MLWATFFAVAVCCFVARFSQLPLLRVVIVAVVVAVVISVEVAVDIAAVVGVFAAAASACSLAFCAAYLCQALFALRFEFAML